MLNKKDQVLWAGLFALILFICQTFLVAVTVCRLLGSGCLPVVVAVSVSGDRCGMDVGGV